MASCHGLGCISWCVQKTQLLDVLCPWILLWMSSSRQCFNAVFQFAIPQDFRIFSTSTGVVLRLTNFRIFSL